MKYDNFQRSLLITRPFSSTGRKNQPTGYKWIWRSRYAFTLRSLCTESLANTSRYQRSKSLAYKLRFHLSLNTSYILHRIYTEPIWLASYATDRTVQTCY